MTAMAMTITDALNSVPLGNSGLALSCFVLFFIFLLIKYPDRLIGTSPRPELPSPPSHPLIGNSWAIIKTGGRNQLDRLREGQETAGVGGMPWTATMPGFGRIVVVNRPEYIEWVQKTSFENYPKGKGFRDAMGGVMGEHGIFVADGDVWRTQRKLASHIFSVSNFKNHVATVVHSELDVLTKLMSRLTERNTDVYLSDIFFRFTLASFGRMAFSAQMNCLSAEPAVLNEVVPFAKAFDFAQLIMDGRFNKPWWKLTEPFSAEGREMRRSEKVINDYAYGIIDHRLAMRASAGAAAEKGNAAKGERDLLDLFMDVTQDRNELRPVVLNFLIAGRDTTAQALSWLYWEFSCHPEHIEPCRREIAKVLTAEDGTIRKVRYDDMKNLVYLHACFHEALRLHPSVPKNGKRAVRDEIILPNHPTLPPVRVKAGEMVGWSDWVMGRMPEVWGDDCLEFKPSRWIDEAGKLRNFGPWKAHFFNAGPRICLGQTLATYEGLAVMAALLAHFDIVVVPGQEPPHYEDSLTLPLRGGGYRVRVKAHRS